MQFIPIYVISLARATQRREAILQHLNSHALDYTLIEGVDGASLSSAEINRLLAPGASMHAGAIGCYLSHLKAYQHLVDSGEPVALVLEDDARISRDAVELVHSRLSAPDFDYCFLDCDDHGDKGPVFYDRGSRQALPGRLSAYALSGGPHTLHAYLISRRAAQLRLEHAYPIKKPIDTYDHLPYPIKFAATVNPQGAWVSEHSLVSDTSDRNVTPDSLHLRLFRRWPIFYKMRDWLTFGSLKRRLIAREFVAKGQIPAGRKWAALPRGRDILLEN